MNAKPTIIDFTPGATKNKEPLELKFVHILSGLNQYPVNAN